MSKNIKEQFVKRIYNQFSLKNHIFMLKKDTDKNK